MYVALQYAAIFHRLVEEEKDCEDLRPKPKEKWIFVDKRRERMKHRTERGSKQVPMYEMRKRKLMHENARQM